MPMKFNSDNELLEFVSDQGVSWTHAQGYYWFWREFIPALERATVLSSVSSEIIADCYYVAGDVHDFNDAPKTAIQCYQKALKADPNCGAAHREIANMLGRMGRYDKALVHCEKALALNPNDRHAVSDREDYIGENRLKPPLYIVGDANWVASEHLAKSNPKKALNTLGNTKRISSLRVKAHCYGAMERTEEYLDAWSEFVSNRDEIEFTYADWFFMEDRVYHEPAFWEVLLSSKARLSGVFTVFDGLDESDRYKSLSTHEKIRLRIEYYVYAQSEDTKGLKALYKKFPEWIELRKALAS